MNFTCFLLTLSDHVKRKQDVVRGFFSLFCFGFLESEVVMSVDTKSFDVSMLSSWIRCMTVDFTDPESPSITKGIQFDKIEGSPIGFLDIGNLLRIPVFSEEPGNVMKFACVTDSPTIENVQIGPFTVDDILGHKCNSPILIEVGTPYEDNPKFLFNFVLVLARIGSGYIVDDNDLCNDDLSDISHKNTDVCGAEDRDAGILLAVMPHNSETSNFQAPGSSTEWCIEVDEEGNLTVKRQDEEGDDDKDDDKKANWNGKL